MIRLICLGKPSAEYRSLIDEYEKRLKRFEVVEIKEKKSLAEERELIEPKVKGELIVLDALGEQLSSEAFASLLKEKDVTLVIGSHQGVDEQLKKKGKLVSLSTLTLPHQIARLVLTEQVYRSQTIWENKKYHK